MTMIPLGIAGTHFLAAQPSKAGAARKGGAARLDKPLCPSEGAFQQGVLRRGPFLRLVDDDDSV